MTEQQDTVIRVYLVDEDTNRLQGAARQLEGMGHLVHAVGAVSELLTLQLARPCCVVINGLTESESMTVLAQARDAGLKVPVLVVSDFSSVEQLLPVIEKGPTSFLDQHVTAAEWGSLCAQAVAADKAAFDAEEQQSLVANSIDSLTPRQQMVLEHAIRGKANKSIAKTLGLSQRTIESERSEILKAFQSDSITEIAYRVGMFRAGSTVDLPSSAVPESQKMAGLSS